MFLEKNRKRILEEYKKTGEQFPEFFKELDRKMRELTGSGAVGETTAEDEKDSERKTAVEAGKASERKVSVDAGNAAGRGAVGHEKDDLNRACANADAIILALKYLYAYAPASDMGNYPFEVFLDYAAHGVFLRSREKRCADLPEEIYLNYVLYHRVNEEEIRPCRRLFYDKLKDRIRGKSCEEAALEVNYWCAEEATYQSSDDRTRSALAVYNCGYGRCGEESVFLVNALRSAGIPARQVYAPRWSHCDDNHAWVEIWIDGEWHFAGACEPEPRLDRGWFVHAASRAMMVHARQFDPVLQEPVAGREGMVFITNELSRYARTVDITVTVSRDGEEYREISCNERLCTDVATANCGSRKEHPEEGATVSFQVLNGSEYYPIAEQVTGTDGTVTLKNGLGSLYIRAWKDGKTGEAWIDTRKEQNIRICLKKEYTSQLLLSKEQAPQLRLNKEHTSQIFLSNEQTIPLRPGKENGSEMQECWAAHDFYAPESNLSRNFSECAAVNETENLQSGKESVNCQYGEETANSRFNEKTENHQPGKNGPDSQFGSDRREEKRKAAARLEATVLKRKSRKEGWRNPEIEKFLQGEAKEQDSCKIIFDGKAVGNSTDEMPTRGKISESFPEGNPTENVSLRRELLQTLSKKDLTDLDSRILEEHMHWAKSYTERYLQTTEIFVNYVLNPRVDTEILSCYRKTLEDAFTEEQKSSFLQSPEQIWWEIQRSIREYPERERRSVITTPAACLKLGVGSRLSQKILFVAIARTLGIPARLNPVDQVPEYWKNGGFLPVFTMPETVDELNNIGTCIPKKYRSSKLIIRKRPEDTWIYHQNWTIGRLEGGDYRSLNLCGMDWKSDQQPNLILQLWPGQYRIITTNRLPNGNSFSFQYEFILEAGQEKTVELRLREAQLKDMLTAIPLPDFALYTEQEEVTQFHDLVNAGVRLFLWLEEGKEPTEHILNELMELRSEFASRASAICLILKEPKSLAQETLKNMIRMFPEIRILYDDFGDTLNRLARRMYMDPGSLPFILAVDQNRTGIYAASGYNVGTAAMLQRIMKCDQVCSA